MSRIVAAVGRVIARLVHLVRRRRWGWPWTPDRPWCWRSRRPCFAWRAAVERHVAVSTSARPTEGLRGSSPRSGRCSCAADAAACYRAAAPTPPTCVGYN